MIWFPSRYSRTAGFFSLSCEFAVRVGGRESGAGLGGVKAESRRARGGRMRVEMCRDGMRRRGQAKPFMRFHAFVYMLLQQPQWKFVATAIVTCTHRNGSSVSTAHVAWSPFTAHAQYFTELVRWSDRHYSRNTVARASLALSTNGCSQ